MASDNLASSFGGDSNSLSSIIASDASSSTSSTNNIIANNNSTTAVSAPAAQTGVNVLAQAAAMVGNVRARTNPWMIAAAGVRSSGIGGS